MSEASSTPMSPTVWPEPGARRDCDGCNGTGVVIGWTIPPGADPSSHPGNLCARCRGQGYQVFACPCTKGKPEECSAHGL